MSGQVTFPGKAFELSNAGTQHMVSKDGKFRISNGEGEECLAKVCCLGLGVIMLIIGVILWPVGAAQGNAAMVLAGRILFGIGLPLTVGMIAGICKQ